MSAYQHTTFFCTGTATTFLFVCADDVCVNLKSSKLIPQNLWLISCFVGSILLYAIFFSLVLNSLSIDLILQRIRSLSVIRLTIDFIFTLIYLRLTNLNRKYPIIAVVVVLPFAFAAEGAELTCRDGTLDLEAASSDLDFFRDRIIRRGGWKLDTFWLGSIKSLVLFLLQCVSLRGWRSLEPWHSSRKVPNGINIYIST